MYKDILGKVVHSIIEEDVETAQAALSEYMSLKARQVLEGGGDAHAEQHNSHREAGCALSVKDALSEQYNDVDSIPESHYRDMWREESGIFHAPTREAVSNIGIDKFYHIMNDLQHMVDADLHSSDPGARSFSNTWYDWQDKHGAEVKQLPKWALDDIRTWLRYYTEDVWAHADEQNDYTDQSMRQGEMGR